MNTARNAVVVALHNRNYYLAHQEELKRKRREHYAANRLRIRAAVNAQRKTDPEPSRRRARESYYRRREEVLARLRSKWADGHQRLAKYRLTKQDYEVLWKEHEGRCPICLEPLATNAPVDHDHQTGAIRGLLCSPCNRGLGHFRDSPESLGRAITYLEANR